MRVYFRYLPTCTEQNVLGNKNTLGDINSYILNKYKIKINYN